MQTKNINHHYRQDNQQQAGSVSLCTTQQQPFSSVTTTRLHSSSSSQQQQNRRTCQSNRSKTPVPSSAAAAQLTTITYDDCCGLETGQFPTSEQAIQQSSGTNHSSLNSLQDARPRPSVCHREDQVTTFTDRMANGEDVTDCMPVEHNEHCQHYNQALNNDCVTQSRRVTSLSGSHLSLTTLSAFVNGAPNHHPGHQHTSCDSPSQQMLLCAVNSKTPPHHHQQAYSQPRCLLNSESTTDPPAQLSTNIKSTANFGHSSTLPPNSTLSSLLATAKANDQRNMYQQELRRQTSLNQLDKITVSKPKWSIGKSDPKQGSFQQRIKAILSPQKDAKSVNKLTSKQKDQPSSQLTECSDSHSSLKTNNSVPVSCDSYASLSFNSQNHVNRVDRPLNTLNKYTISASSNNLTSPTHLITEEVDHFEEEDTYNLRNVCSKLFGQKQYCQHNKSSSQLLSDNIMSSVQKNSVNPSNDQKCHRNITPEMNVEKVTHKEIIYSSYNRNPSQLPDIACTVKRSTTPALCNSNQPNPALDLSANNDNSLQMFPNKSVSVTDTGTTEHVVVVSDLNSKSRTCDNGLTVRTQTPERVVTSKSVHSANINTNNNSTTTTSSNNNQGSNLSLNVVEASESVTSQEHNYKSSSESGRGTMNSHVEDRSPHNIDLNSPADLTSLDSDQSNRLEVDWNEQNGGTCARRCAETVNKTNYSKIQRYLDDHRCSNQKDNELTICKEFQSKLSINGESDSWTSISDEPSVKKSSKSKGAVNAVKNGKNLSTKHRYQTEAKLKTNFSKPENCVNPKQAALSVLPVSPSIKAKISPNSHKLQESHEMKSSNGMPYDKCIYSVPNKGKYRTMTPFNGMPCDQKLCESPFGKDCDEDSLSSETQFPDDGCSEYASEWNAVNGSDPLRKQLRGIEDMYSELLGMLNSKSDRPRRKLFRRNSGRSSVASRTTRDFISRKYRNEYRRSKSCENAQVTKRYKKLESQVLTLAKSVSQLSADIQFNYMLNEEMDGLRHEIEMLKTQIVTMKQHISTLNKTQQHQQQQHQQVVAQQANATLNRNSKESKKVDKIKRLFVDETQPMKQFLKKLGYDKYLKQFEAEKIGLAELVHLNEDRLQKLGIPMGPRIRILQEARNLSLILQGKQTQQLNKSTLPNMADTFNIYAMV